MKLRELIDLVDRTDASEMDAGPAVELAGSDRVFTIEGDALKYAESEWELAKPGYGLDSRADRLLCMMSLLAVGIIDAEQSGKSVVSQENIRTGWAQLSLCPGNSPPHTCLGKAVVARRDDLLRRNDILGEALQSLGERGHGTTYRSR